MIYPKFPNKGDTIGICAPSAGVGHKLESFDLSLSAIREQGYSIVETASVRVDSIRPATAEVRADEFHSLISNPDVSAIIAATGGEYNYEVLPYLDAATIADHPKWCCGYSDPTNILYYMTTALDIASIYGFNAGSFDWRPLHKFQTNALNLLGGSSVEQHSFDFWDSARNWEAVSLDTPVSWDLYLPGCDTANAKSCDFSGRIIGGCTDVIAKLIGTPYDGTYEFVSRYLDDGFIWYFDTFEMSADALYLTMLQFKYAGYFENAQAIILGRVMYPGDSTDADYIDKMKRVFSDIPFIWGADIGHTKPAMSMVNGSLGQLHCEKGEAIIKQEYI